MAIILPYPAVRRRGFIRRQGSWLADIPRREAEKHLAYQLRKQRETMVAKGIDPAEADRQISTLEIAIRCEITKNLVTARDLDAYWAQSEEDRAAAPLANVEISAAVFDALDSQDGWNLRRTANDFLPPFWRTALGLTPESAGPTPSTSGDAPAKDSTAA